MLPDGSDAQIAAELSRFIVTHPDSLGLAPGIAATDLELTPHRSFRGEAGALRILRFDQTYRGFPVFGPDAVIKLVATSAGVLSLRGALLDSRLEYKHAAEQSTAANAAANIRFHVAQQTGLATADLELNDLRLVAVPRSRAIGWAASVDRGLTHIATVVVEADPTITTPHSKLLYFSDDIDAGLADEVPVSVRAENRSSDVLNAPVGAAVYTVLVDGSLLHGSALGDATILGDERVVAYDAIDATNSDSIPLIPPFSAAGTSFTSPPGSREFRVQDAYVAAQNFYTWTDRFMSGRWDSLLGAASSFPPGQYSPRLMVYENVGYDICGDQSFCASFMKIDHMKKPAAEYQQPLEGSALEMIGWFAIEDTAGITAATLAHEFGHFIDYFAEPESIAAKFKCKDCIPSCEPNSTDESGALVESFANFTALWLLRDLYEVGQSPTDCAVTQAVSRGGSRSPHVEGCTNNKLGKIALFLPSGAPGCAGFSCDAPDQGDISLATGICSGGPGYRIDSFHQALWEAFHAQTCDLYPPYACSPLPALKSDPAGDIVGGALLYALRVNTATYRGFADDMATYIACNHGEAAYDAFNEILCHHEIRACDAVTPVLCESCGNGIREGNETCDGTDFGGQSCVSLGLEAGSLACNADCTVEESGCVTDTPTTGAETHEPSPDSFTGTGIVLDSDATAGSVDAGGCSCRSAPTGSWLTALLAGALVRRRRRATLGFVALCSLLTSQGGCGPVPMEKGDTSTSGSSTGPAMSTGDTADRPLSRMFGEFHDERDQVGYMHEDETEGWYLYFWGSLRIHQNGTLTVTNHNCTAAWAPQEFTWVLDGDKTLRVIPDAYFSDGTFKFSADQVKAVSLTQGQGCDDIEMLIEYPPDSGRIAARSRWLPGEVCAEGSGQDCVFTFVWCDGAAPPACME